MKFKFANQTNKRKNTTKLKLLKSEKNQDIFIFFFLTLIYLKKIFLFN